MTLSHRTMNLKKVKALQSLNSGIFTATQVSVDGTNMNSKVGTIHGTNIDVYVDTFATDSYALVGYRDATNAQNNGIVYMPYIPLQVVKSVMPYDGSPNIMMLSRYGVYANQLGSGCFHLLRQFPLLEVCIGFIKFLLQIVSFLQFRLRCQSVNFYLARSVNPGLVNYSFVRSLLCILNSFRALVPFLYAPLGSFIVGGFFVLIVLLN